MQARLNNLLAPHAQRWRHNTYNSLVRRFSRMQAQNLHVNGMEIPCLVAGQGETLVLIHGFADQKETWSLIAPWLARGRRVIALDLPGYGDASALEHPSGSAITALARFLESFLDTLGIESAHLCGNSMGGGVALALAAQSPKRVKSLILLASVGPSVHDSQLKECVERGVNPLLPSSMIEYEAMLDFIFERRPPLPGPVRRHLAQRHIERREIYAAQFDHLLDDFPDEYPQLTAPTLIIHGSRDRLIHPSTATVLAQRIPGAQLVMLPAIGHAPQWEAPRKTINAIQDFLVGLGTAP